MILRRRYQIFAVLLDSFLLGAALHLAFLVRFEGSVPAVEQSLFRQILPLLLVVYPLTFLFTGIYRMVWGHASTTEYLALIRSFLIALVVMVAALFYIRVLGASRLVLVYFSGISFSLLVLWRALMGLATRAAWRRGLFLTEAVVVGDLSSARVVEQTFRDPVRGIKIVRVMALEDPQLDSLRDPESGLPANVILALSEEHPLQIMGILDRLAGRPGMTVTLVPGVLSLMANRAPVSEAGGLLLLDVGLTRSSDYYLPLKRLMDGLGAVAALTAALPVFLVAALGIFLSSGRPVVFTQERIGRNGQPFQIYKFRTMRVGAEKEAMLTAKDDERVFGFGRFLRRWSLDELPQLVNILKGEMSFVGPRPEIPPVVARYEPWQRRALEALPGLTGLSQVSGRDNLSLEEKSRVDLYYVKHRSFALDLSILIKTIGAVLSGEGQY